MIKKNLMPLAILYSNKEDVKENLQKTKKQEKGTPEKP